MIPSLSQSGSTTKEARRFHMPPTRCFPHDTLSGHGVDPSHSMKRFLLDSNADSIADQVLIQLEMTCIRTQTLPGTWDWNEYTRTLQGGPMEAYR